MLESVITIAKQAGAAVLECYTSDAPVSVTTKTDASPVTNADIVSNRIILEGLSATGIPVLSEESLGVPLPYPEKLWLVDPLDGTKDFIDRTGDFSVMIALLEKGVPTLAVVYAPVLQTLYVAERGKGGFVRDSAGERKLLVSTKDVPGARFLSSVHHFSPDMQTVADTLNSSILRRGSAGLKAGLIAEAKGEYMLTFEEYREWDVAPAHLIIIEAGGQVSDTSGNALVYGNTGHRLANGFVGSNGIVHNSVLEAIQKVPKHFAP